MDFFGQGVEGQQSFGNDDGAFVGVGQNELLDEDLQEVAVALFQVGALDGQPLFEFEAVFQVKAVEQGAGVVV